MATAKTTFPLREWIRGALCYNNLNGNTGGCCRDTLPREYLIASLRIAISLSHKIEDAESMARFGISDVLNREQSYQMSNRSMPDWAEFITVRLKDDCNAIEEGQDSPYRLSSIPNESQPYAISIAPAPSYISGIDEELQALLDECVDGSDKCLVAPSVGTGSNTTYEPQQDQNDRSYLNIHSADICSIADSRDCEIDRSDTFFDNQHRIYFLGLVFYELFSGGVRPPPELIINPTSCDDASNKKSGSRAVDFLTGLNVSDETSIAKRCEIFNDSNNDRNGNDPLRYEDRCGPEDLDDSCTESGRRKRQSTLSRSLRYSQCNQGERENGIALCKVTVQLSIEQLKSKGVPASLCNVIYNMIDCINGDFSGDESYSNISDVTCDLCLMANYPEKFLRDLDIDSLSLTRLTLNETVFVRNDEFASLQCSYRRSASGSPELALIAGESGTGKSWLADRLGQYIVANGGVFLKGKFDRLHQSQPFSALAAALNSYCDLLIEETNQERASWISSKIRGALGRDACHLVRVIPTLSKIIVVDECEVGSEANKDCMDAQQRIYYLMYRFVETISIFSDRIIALFLDDLQWADEVSISVIGHVLKSYDANKRFFFLGCYRDDEIGNDHPFFKMIGSVQGLGVTTRIVKLECMDKDMVTKMLSNLLCLFPRLVRSLSEIVYYTTKGNPLFFSHLILSLHRDGLLYLSLTRRRWEWNEEQILSRSLPEDVAILFSYRIGRLPSDVKSALCALSCFGSSVEVDVIEKLEACLGDSLIDPLALAEKEGFVNKSNGKFHFFHDRIQEVAYNMIPEEQRCLYHMKYGLSLAELSLNANKKNTMLCVAVGQINLGGPSAISNDEQRLEIVKYNLAAGKMAVDMSEFHSAFHFFDNGITFLKKTYWKDHYALSLELHELAAECALITRDAFSLTVLTDQVLKYARSFEDTLNISYICMSTLGYASKISDSVEMGLDIMTKLGEELPRSFSDDTTEDRIKSTHTMLDEISVTKLLNYRMMTDKKKMMAMKFLRRLASVSHQVHPNLLPVVTLKMVELTVAHGMSSMSPIGFAYLGSLVAKVGDIKGGYKCASLAKSLVDKMNLKEIAGEVYWVSIEILCYIEPLPVANENRIDCEAIALGAGDVTWACYSRLMYTNGIFWSGSKLSVSADIYFRGRRFLMSQGHVTTENYLLILQRSILILIGADEGEFITDDELKRRVLANNNPFQVTLYYFQKTFVAFILDDHHTMKESAEEYFKSTGKSWLMMSLYVFHVLIVGLVSFRIYRETKVALWLERGTKFKSQMQSWSEKGSSWNFESKYLLLQAEEHFCNDNIDAAKFIYDKAISSAKAHKWVHEEAIAYELAANFYFNLRDYSTSLEYFTAAHEKYQKWGAVCKVTRLYKCIQEKFATCLGVPKVCALSFIDGFEQGSVDSDPKPRKRKQT